MGFTPAALQHNCRSTYGAHLTSSVGISTSVCRSLPFLIRAQNWSRRLAGAPNTPPPFIPHAFPLSHRQLLSNACAEAERNVIAISSCRIARIPCTRAFYGLPRTLRQASLVAGAGAVDVTRQPRLVLNPSLSIPWGQTCSTRAATGPKCNTTPRANGQVKVPCQRSIDSCN